MNELIDTLLDPHSWPVFYVALAKGSRLHVIMGNFPDEGGVDYVLDPGNGGGSIPLAAMEGHFRGPALAWPELVAAAHQPGQGRDWAERLLLLLPRCADSSRPSTAIDVVSAALTSIGAGPNAREVGAKLLNSRRYWRIGGNLRDAGDGEPAALTGAHLVWLAVAVADPPRVVRGSDWDDRAAAGDAAV